MGKTIRKLPFHIRREISNVITSLPSDHIMMSTISDKLPKSAQRTMNISYSGGIPGYVYKFNDRSIKIPPKKQYDAPCPCCFGVEGRMWMLTGLGNKSINKAKGMHKHNDKLKLFNNTD